MVAAPSGTRPQRYGMSFSWPEHAVFSGRSYASKRVLRSCCHLPFQLSCAPCSFFCCVSCLAEKTEPLEKGAWEGRRRLGAAKVAGAIADSRLHRAGDGGTPGQEQRFGCYGESQACRCVLLAGALRLPGSAVLGAEERLWKRQVVSRAAVLPQGSCLCCSCGCLDFLPHE